MVPCYRSLYGQVLSKREVDALVASKPEVVTAAMTYFSSDSRVACAALVGAYVFPCDNAAVIHARAA